MLTWPKVPARGEPVMRAARLKAIGLLMTMVSAAMLWAGSVAQAQAPTSALALALNKSSFSVGDTFALTLINENGASGTGDLYVAIQLPDGSAYAFDGTQWHPFSDGTHPASDAPKPFRANT